MKHRTKHGKLVRIVKKKCIYSYGYIFNILPMILAVFVGVNHTIFEIILKSKQTIIPNSNVVGPAN